VQLRPVVLARMAASIPNDVRAEFDSLTRRQMQALSALPGAGLTMRELASALGVSGATATVLGDRLVAQGLAVRETDPADRRIVRLAPTDQGAALTERYRDAQRQAVTELLGSLTDEQVTAWLDIMQTLAGASARASTGAGHPAEMAGAGR
jgi:DNA-binding MarR family transcriptional regulator